MYKKRPGSWPITVAKRIVREYIKSYRKKRENVTQSAFNLKRIGEVVERLDALSQELISSLPDPNVFRAITSSWRNSPKFFWGNYIDLYRFSELLRGNCKKEAIRERAKELLAALKPGKGKAILSKKYLGKEVENTHGISIYFPSSWINPLYKDLDLSRDCKWGEFLESYLR